jgi:hypothetical protein
LNAALLEEGRDPTSMRRTVGVWIEDESVPAERRDPEAFSGNETELLRLLADYQELGVDDLIMGLTPMNTASLERLAAAVAAFRGHSSTLAQPRHGVPCCQSSSFRYLTPGNGVYPSAA